MANIFASGITETGKPPQNVSGYGYHHARKRETLAPFIDVQPTTSDVIVIDILRSSSQLREILFACDGAGTNGALNIGLHKVTFSNGGVTLTVIDADLFASAKATGTAILLTVATATVFTEAGTLTDFDRGKALWQLADIGAGTYTADPGEVWAITATPSTSEDAASDYLFQISYVAGD